MALSPTFTSGSPHGLFPIDPSAVFEPGQIGGLIDIGGDTFATVSDGQTIPPFGIIDDINTTAFRRPVIDDITFVPSVGIADGYGKTVNPTPVMGKLRETNLIANSFAANFTVQLDPKHGTIIIPAGTVLNHMNSLGALDGFEVVASYSYSVADIPGDSSVSGSGLVTLHIFRGIFETDQYDTTVDYPLNAPLYCGRDGRITTRVNGSILGSVVGRPSTIHGTLTFLWL